MVIRNKEYYAQYDEEMKRIKRVVDYHARQAERYKRIYQGTKGRSGLYGLLNKWAKRQNEYHYNKGVEMATVNMKWCLCEMIYLQNYIQNKGGES